MKIFVELPNHITMPDPLAYKEYFESYGDEVTINSDYDINENFDVIIKFQGYDIKKNNKSFLIHDYVSSSIGKFQSLKNFFKIIFSVKPNLRLFLNKDVHKSFFNVDDVTFMYRDMGYFDSSIQKAHNNKLYDVVYAGSIEGREGLLSCILDLRKNFKKIAVAGKANKKTQDVLISHNIKYLGILNREEIDTLFNNSKYGLNYVPNTKPFNFQTSTKVIEYLSRDMGVISNRYQWIEKFSLENDLKINFLDEEISEFIAIPQSDKIIKYNWMNLLKQVELREYIIDRIHFSC